MNYPKYTYFQYGFRVRVFAFCSIPLGMEKMKEELLHIEESQGTIKAYLQLTKMRIVAMVLNACLIAMLLAGGRLFSLNTLWSLLATALLSAGSAALNQYIDREADAKMERTRHRVIPSGIIAPGRALAFGLALIVIGGLIALWKVNALTAGLGLLSATLYDLVYTPMKRYTWLNTSVGAIPGALPTLMGWAAVQDRIGAGGWILFTMVFLWQHVHFYSIAWMYKKDYRRGGFAMLPVVQPDGRSTFGWLLFSAVALIPVSVLLTALGLAGPVYCLVSIILGVVMLLAGIGLTRTGTPQAARTVLLSTLFYLPVLLGTLLLEHYL